MSAPITPATIWPDGFTVGTDQIIFNTADHEEDPLLTELTSSEAAADYREIIRAILSVTEANFAALGVNTPNKFNIRKSQSLDSDGNVIESYSVRVTIEATLGSTVPE